MEGVTLINKHVRLKLGLRYDDPSVAQSEPSGIEVAPASSTDSQKEEKK